MDVCIRGAEHGDAEAVDQLILYLDEFHARARGDLFRIPHGRPRGEDFLATVLRDPEQQIFVAESGGEVIGYIHVLITNSGTSAHQVERRYSEINTISVRPSAQRLGAGRKLIEAALSWAASKRIHDHQIAVHEFNGPARALYEQLDFAPSITVLRRKD